ncbi:MAG: hypothetical protein QOI80_1825 [Solirubrobacteraceae bacterium]|jgi:hypothetical protein|nr:hypothetical protein [Solirubrobacteraceae bacterium]
MPWKVEGRYFENCTCNVPCPCTASFDMGADYDRCQVILVFHVDAGDVDGVDVGGMTVAAVGDTPKVMTDGDWRLGILIDETASDEQAEALGGVFSGALGGPMAALAPLIGENLGAKRVAMEFSSEGGKHSLNLADMGHVEVEDVVPFGIETGEPVRLVGVFHPAGSELTIAKAGDTKLSAFGIEPELAGQSGFSAPFAWSA